MTKTSIFTVGLALSILSWLLLCGCASTTGQGTMPQDPIKIGSILILSGEGAAWGNAERNGIDMAVEDINAEGGIGGRPVQVDFQDDKYDPAVAISAFRKFVDADDIKVIIGPTWSRTGLPLAPLADQEKVLMISPSLGVKEFNEQSPYLFNTWPHDYILSESLADMIYQQGHRGVALIGAKESWTQDQTEAFTRRFNELGGQVAITIEPSPEDKDLRPEALKVKAIKELDAVVLTNGVLDVGPISAKRMREVGITLPFYSVSLDKNIIRSAGDAYEGLVFPTFLTPGDGFAKRYKERFNIDVDIGGDSAYDATMLIAIAMRETKSTDPTVLQSYLHTIKDYDGVSGHLVSDGKGGFTKPFRVYKVTGGSPVLIS